MSVLAAENSGNSGKRKAPSEEPARNVRTKASADSISLSVSEDQAYLLLARLDPDDDLFKSLVKDLIRRSEPERRFQEAMLDDILTRLRVGGMDEANMARARKILDENLRAHLTQRFSEGIGRTQPTLKHLRNVFLQVLQAFERAHPGQGQRGLASDMYKLFTSHLANNISQDDGTNGNSPAGQQAVDDAIASSIAESYLQELNGSVPPRDSLTSPDPGSSSMVKSAAAAPRPNGLSSNDIGSAATSASTASKTVTNAVHSVRPNGSGAVLTGINNLIDEVVSKQSSGNSNAANPSDRDMKVPVTLRAVQPDAKGSNSSNSKLTRRLSEPSGRDKVHDLDPVMARLPTSQIDPARLTCWYWYHRAPPCEKKDACRFQHRVTSYIAARDRTRPPSLLTSEARPTRSADGTGRGDGSGLTSPLTIKGRAGDVTVKQEQRPTANVKSKTPVLDYFLAPNAVVSLENREAVLDKIMNKILSRGPANSFVTRLKGIDGKFKDLSLTAEVGFRSKLFGLFNTFGRVPAALRTSLDSQLRAFVVANREKFSELRPHLQESRIADSPRDANTNSGRAAADLYRPGDIGNEVRSPGRDDTRTNNTKDTNQKPRGYDSYSPGAGASVGVLSLESRPTFNDQTMTCPYWLRGGCSKGQSCKFRHEITSWVAAPGGRGKPQALKSDGTIIY